MIKETKTKHGVITTLPNGRDRIQLLEFPQLLYFESFWRGTKLPLNPKKPEHGILVI